MSRVAWNARGETFFLSENPLGKLYCSVQQFSARSLWLADIECFHRDGEFIFQISVIAEESVTKTNCRGGGTCMKRWWVPVTPGDRVLFIFIEPCSSPISHSLSLTPSLSLLHAPLLFSPLSHSHSRFFFQISSARVTQPQFSALFNSEQSVLSRQYHRAGINRDWKSLISLWRIATRSSNDVILIFNGEEVGHTPSPKLSASDIRKKQREHKLYPISVKRNYSFFNVFDFQYGKKQATRVQCTYDK